MAFSIWRKQIMEVTKDARVADILKEYGDIADVMEVFGIKRVGRYSIRALAAKVVTVEWAAGIPAPVISTVISGMIAL
jgi:hypothetical protein